MKHRSDGALCADRVVMRFGRTVALDGLDLQVEPGKVTVLLGPNGAGKSTLMRLAIGVLRPRSGTLSVLGRDPVREPDAVRRRVGYVPDRPDAPAWMRLNELLRFAAAHWPGVDLDTARALADRLAVPVDTRLGAMSKGQAMKTMLVLALAHDPELLMLDEPFGGLDPLVREDVLRGVLGALRDDRRTVLCATHELDVAARIADRVAVVTAGVLRAHGTVDEVLGDGAAEVADVPRRLHEALERATGRRIGTIAGAATC